MNYEKLFKKTLLREADDQFSVNMTNPPESENQNASPDVSSDETAWNQNNPDITSNDELKSKFDVEGLDKDEIEKYSEIITQWGQGIQTAIDQLAQIIKFAAGEKLANAPGSEQFSALIKDAPNLKRDLSAFKSQVEDLEQTVKLAINDAAKERKDKISALSK